MFWRKRAIEAARQWILARFEKSDGLGAIFPPVVFSTVALKALGYADDRARDRRVSRSIATPDD